MATEHMTADSEMRLSDRAQRRRSTVYKTANVQEAEGYRAISEIDTSLRREGFFSCLLTICLTKYRAGARQALATRRGPSP